MHTALKSMGYAALNLCTGRRGLRRAVDGEFIRFPARWSRYYPAGYEPATFAFLRAHCWPGDTVLDVGAHIGVFSVVMARRVQPSGRVFSFEPTDFTRRVLSETLRLNGSAQIVEVRSEAVTDRTGAMTFYDTGDPVSNANGLIPTARTRASRQVATVSIDDFARARGLHIQCIKLDVEGAEMSVLLGAMKTLLACRPFLHVALHPGALRNAGVVLSEVWDFARAHGMVVARDGELAEHDWFCEQTGLFDVQLLPRECLPHTSDHHAGHPA